MKANAAPLLSVFEKKIRLEVPLFQRQYVWNKEQQWEPLWEDISRKFTEYLEGRKDTPIHFLGAMVLDQRFTPTTHVERRQIIDGQQRLTTLQIFLAALRDFCSAQNCHDLADEVELYILNKGMMSDPEVDKFKVWPTAADRAQFRDVMTAGSGKALEALHPLRYKKWARNPDPRPRMVDAYLFFYARLAEFLLGTIEGGGRTELVEVLAGDVPLPARLEECFQALKNALQIVAIDLDVGDDAQVIFETLNARGEPLLPADLLRNYIFLRAARLDEHPEELYRRYWSPFDDDFWREETRQGRLSRPRSDLFMQHFLASRQGVDIPVKHLFVEYKFWIEKTRPFPTVEAELQTLAQQRNTFRRLISPEPGDPFSPLAKFLTAFDVSTVYPLVLWFTQSDRTDEEIADLSLVIESYIVRRAICDRTIKNYNKLFLRIITSLHKEELRAPADVAAYLGGLTGDSSEWPTDDAFSAAWRESEVYNRLTQSRLNYILLRLNERYYTTKMEAIDVGGQLTIEHIMPQSWGEHWPLQSGETGVPWDELPWAEVDEPAVEASRRRHALVQTIGNLTILTQPLNSAVSNSAWAEKRPELLRSSLLPINQHLHEFDLWDEDTIQSRSADLLSKALSLWPRKVPAPAAAPPLMLEV